MSSSSSSSSYTVPALIVSTAGAVVGCFFLFLQERRIHDEELRNRQIADLEIAWSQKRQEERTGRIRAEVKLRQVMKEFQQLQNERIAFQRMNTSSSNDCEENDNDLPPKKIKNTTLLIESIGTIVSPYTKRMGTPRQPQLVPASRGYIQMTTVPAASLDGISEYSHLWIIFEFHANTDTGSQSKRTKIRPPRANGLKVGQLATRSPHRPNAIGLSLVQVQRWDETKRQLHVSGLDLVNGTPVYDIKPCVPWDVPGYYLPSQHSRSLYKDVIRVPWWVHQEDEIQTVTFTNAALHALRSAVYDGHLAPLYTTDNDGFEGARETLQQVLAQDPRSSHKGLKQNARGTKTTTQNEATDDNKDSLAYNIVFAQVQVSFVVVESGVKVTDIVPVTFDADSYVDGIPLISKGLKFQK